MTLTLTNTLNIRSNKRLGRTRKARLSRLADAYLFFRENAEGIVGQSAKGAIALARAEIWARRYGYDVSWEPDYCSGCMCGNDD